MILRHIEIGGKARPFLFSYKAIKEMQTVDLTQKDELDYMSFLGFKYGAIKEAKDQGKEPVIDFTEADIEDWFEEDLTAFSEVSDALNEMRYTMEKMKAPQNRQQSRSQKKD